MDLRVDLRINGERRIAGKLKGYDQFMNIVLDEAIELVQNKKVEGKQEL
jgi:small nuclear ribonucleoprotein G